MIDAVWTYADGTPLRVGDAVLIARRHPGKVWALFAPNSPEARDYGCFETGGFMIQTADGELFLHTRVDEDVEKVP